MRQVGQEKGNRRQQKAPRSSQCFLLSLLFGLSCERVCAWCTPCGQLGPAHSDFFQESLGLLALVSSVIYAPFCISTYFLQLSIVAFNPLSLSSEVLKAINFMPGSPTFAIDMLGYGFLCLSTLAAGFALADTKDKVLRALCFFHGALVVPTLAAPIISGVFLSTSGETDYTGHYVLLFWCIVFVPIALLFMRYFKEGQRLDVSPGKTH
jgi:hypothetical protein